MTAKSCIWSLCKRRRVSRPVRRSRLLAEHAVVMHPGPMNRGVEIESSVADGAQSVILQQVTFGIAVRMAVMSILGAN